MARRWDDLKHKATPEQRAESRRWAKDEAARLETIELDLKGIREALGLTQAQLADAMEMTQGQVSDTERRADLLLSTLSRYVHALGGKLEIVANIKGKRIPLHAE
jgi:DNA-binding transcriptional regulator YiaG